jgi:hypothetical protein
MVSKYFKAKGICNKIYFQEESIQEISYYLHNSQEKQHIMLETSDSEVFGKGSPQDL